MANLALGYGAMAWARILAGAERVVVAELLGLMAMCDSFLPKIAAKLIGQGF